MRHPSQEHLQDLAAGEATGIWAWRAKRHVRTCEACACAVEEWRGLVEDLEQLETLAPPSDLATRVMARVRVPRPEVTGPVPARIFSGKRPQLRPAFVLAMSMPLMLTTVLMGAGLTWLFSMPGVDAANLVTYALMHLEPLVGSGWAYAQAWYDASLLSGYATYLSTAPPSQMALGIGALAGGTTASSWVLARAVLPDIRPITTSNQYDHAISLSR